MSPALKYPEIGIVLIIYIPVLDIAGKPKKSQFVAM